MRALVAILLLLAIACASAAESTGAESATAEGEREVAVADSLARDAGVDTNHAAESGAPGSGPVEVEGESAPRVVEELDDPSGETEDGRPEWYSPVEPGDPCDDYD